MAVKKTFEFFFGPLLKKFFQDMGRDPNNLEMILLRQKAGQLFKDSNKVINFPQKRSFKEEIEAMKKSGDLVDKDNIIISDKITEREMFKNSNLNKPTIEGQMEKITGASNKINQAQKEIDEMYRPKTDAEIKAKFDKQNQESIQRFKDKMKKDEPDDMATGGRAGFYTGGITDVEPSLDDIGHGADAMMSRTRLMSPGSQTTTSTGLNYLLAEDNDNMRIPFSAGGGGRRAFLKLLATLGGATAAVKSGIIGLGEGTTKKAITETVKQSAGSTYPPPYFYKLVEKIKFMGDDTLATKDKANAYKYKDYTMEEDFAGNIEIIKKGIKDEPDTPEVFMSLKVDEVPLKGKKGSTKVQEYEEFTGKRDYKGDLDVEQGVPDEVIDEAGDTTAMTLKKADGGRIGFKLGGSGKKFIEKIFGKGSLDVMKSRDPELHKGMLEVVEMFRNRDKEGLKIYLQKFLPHMDDETIEAFIVGDAADAAGQGKYGLDNIQGQLIRLGSGRDYAGKIEAMKKLDNAKKLDTLDVTEEMIRKPNSDGGRIGFFLGGGATAGKGLLRQMLNYMSKGSSSGKTGSEMLQMVNPKQFEKLLNDPSMYNKISPELGITAPELIKNMIKKTKDDRTGMIEELLSSARNIKKVDDDMIGYKNKIIEEMIDKGIDREMAETFADMMSKKIMKEVGPKKATPEITEKSLLELENIQKNLITKDRKPNSSGGLQTMLGE